eukprot:CAMPEP_0171672014 /NCGR_PEP_ID=MMETSP0990-20121206/51720_1 /TAXON_ID=483369 /ORGANISM="non described non described, Strain CCMP2098" /LENGTH=64 /DNA_ID=CAMNT_0012257189 /DNA_START=429 /DNA_END=623 /DNA_ORIENTATION=+
MPRKKASPSVESVLACSSSPRLAGSTSSALLMDSNNDVVSFPSKGSTPKIMQKAQMPTAHKSAP